MDNEDLLYFEDLEVGEKFDCGSIEVTEDEMIEFAERYDPQPIHVDEEAAKESIYGGLIASGWLTAALSARLLVKGYMNKTATLGGSGIDELRWHQPVYAGDTLHVTFELIEKEPAENPEFGHTRAEVVTRNQDGEVILSMYGLGLVRRRDTG